MLRRACKDTPAHGTCGRCAAGSATPDASPARDAYQLARIESSALAELQGVSPDRAHQIPGGAVVARAAMRALDVPSVRICPWALREGVILRRLDSLEDER